MRREKKPNRKKGFGNCKRGHYRPINEEKYKQPMDNYMNSSSIPEYRSSWELAFYKFCDMNPDILYWTTEPFAIQYIKPTDGKPHRYFPDVLIKYKNGKRFLIEIKPSSQKSDPVNLAKWEMAKNFADKSDMQFVVMTEIELKSIIGR